MDLFEMEDILHNISYKEGYSFHHWADLIRDQIFMQLHVLRPDSQTGKMELGKGPVILVDFTWNEDQLVRQAFKQIQSYEEHECREAFKYHDKAIFGPHVSVNGLIDIVLETAKPPVNITGSFVAVSADNLWNPTGKREESPLRHLEYSESDPAKPSNADFPNGKSGAW